jgi:NAD(P)H-flavin reductase
VTARAASYQSVQTFTATVSRSRALTHDVRELQLALVEPAAIDFQPGQFVSFEIERPGSPIPATRAYSIASGAHDRGTIELLLNYVPDGPGSEYLFGLRDGDRTSFRGPVGSFVLRDSPRDLLFVATGTGIAPIRSMLLSLSHAGSPRAMTLFWGLRSERDLYYQDELLRLGEQLPRFSFITTLSQPGGAWDGHVGRVTRLVDARIAAVDNLEVFLCGNGGMIRDVRDVIRRKGLCPIRVEQYYDDHGGARRPAPAVQQESLN